MFSSSLLLKKAARFSSLLILASLVCTHSSFAMDPDNMNGEEGSSTLNRESTRQYLRELQELPETEASVLAIRGLVKLQIALQEDPTFASSVPQMSKEKFMERTNISEAEAEAIGDGMNALFRIMFPKKVDSDGEETAGVSLCNIL